MASIRAVVTNLDGSLLNRDGSLPHQYDALHQLLEDRGIKVIATSARPFGSIRRLFQGHGMPAGIVASDGAVIASLRDGVVFNYVEACLQQGHALRALNAIAATGLSPVLFLARERGYLVVVGLDDPLAIESLRASDATRPFVLADAADAEVLAAQFRVRAIAAFSSRDAIADATAQVGRTLRALPGVRAYSYDDSQFGGGRYSWLNIVSDTKRQAEAVRIILRSHNIAADAFVACGNCDNDLSVLRTARFAFCPANAAISVREVCSSVAPVEEGDAFVSWLLERLKYAAPEQ